MPQETPPSFVRHLFESRTKLFGVSYGIFQGSLRPLFLPSKWLKKGAFDRKKAI